MDDFFRFSKKSGFGVFLVQQNMVKGHIANLGIFLDFFEFLRFNKKNSVFQTYWVLGYSWSTLLWYRCYYSHRSRDALSPVCGIFRKENSGDQTPPTWNDSTQIVLVGFPAYNEMCALVKILRDKCLKSVPPLENVQIQADKRAIVLLD